MQSTRPSTSCAPLMSLGCALLALACAPGTEPTAEPTKRATTDSAAAVAPAEPLAKTTPEIKPTPKEAAPAANAKPAQLHPFAHGVCRYIGVSAVDDQTFVHYRTGSMSGYPKGWIHRVDPRGVIAQTMVFDEAYLDEPSALSYSNASANRRSYAAFRAISSRPPPAPRRRQPWHRPSP